MAEHQNVAVLNKGYTAFIAADMETVAEVYDPEVIWHTGGNSQLSGDHKGKEAVFEFFGKLSTLTNGTFKVEVHDLLANDEHGVCLSIITGSREGKALNQREIHVYHFKGEKIIEAWNYPVDQAKYDEFWS